MSEPSGEITGFANRELSDLLDRFRRRRTKLRAAIDAAAELDRLIPRLEKLLALTAEANTRPAPKLAPVPAHDRSGPTQKERILDVLRRAEQPMRPGEIREATGISSSSLYPTLYELTRNGVTEKTEDGTYLLKEQAA